MFNLRAKNNTGVLFSSPRHALKRFFFRPKDYKTRDIRSWGFQGSASSFFHFLKRGEKKCRGTCRRERCPPPERHGCVAWQVPVKVRPVGRVTADARTQAVWLHVRHTEQPLLPGARTWAPGGSPESASSLRAGGSSRIPGDRGTTLCGTTNVWLKNHLMVVE